MDALTATQKLTAWLRNPERSPRHIGYLGMSGIGNCPRQQYWQFVDPEPTEDRLHWYNWIGYTIENSILTTLREAGLQFVEGGSQMDVIADFDDRFRGHIDHELVDGTLIEIKSINWPKYVRLRLNNQADQRNLDQVQMYLRHGGFSQALIVYVVRDVPHREWDQVQPWDLNQSIVSRPDRDYFLPFWIAEVHPDRDRANKLDHRAMSILEAIDDGKRPECECGWCKR